MIFALIAQEDCISDAELVFVQVPGLLMEGGGR